MKIELLLLLASLMRLFKNECTPQNFNIGLSTMEGNAELILGTKKWNGGSMYKINFTTKSKCQLNVFAKILTETR